MRASLIVSTYNSPDALRRCLWSVFAQDRRDFELVVADDGSGPATAALVAQMAAESPVPLVHVWQPDAGFQKCRILNKALAVAGGERIVVTDGDCVLRRDFVGTHLARGGAGLFTSGSYFKMPPQVSDAIDRAAIDSGRAFTARWLVAQGLPVGVKLLKVLARPPFDRVLDRLSTARRSWNGHSAGCLRADALAVNGFDETMGYGGEDVEFGLRLVHRGLRGVRMRYATVALHLHHERGYVTAEMLAASAATRAQTVAERRLRARVGVDQWLAPDGSARLAPDDRVTRHAPA
jgi:glycosyltransferase involved in cell wall biosynthesis